MGHASSETANRIHFLRLQQLRFEMQSLGKIAAVGDKVCDAAISVPDGTDALVDVIQLAVLSYGSPGCCGKRCQSLMVSHNSR